MKCQYVLFAGLALGLVHCSHNSSDSNSDDGDITVIDLPIQIKPEAKLESDLKNMADLIRAKKGISFRQVTQLMIEKHVKATKNSSITSAVMKEFIRSISPSKKMTPALTKIYYEEKISEKHDGKPLIYNARKNNIVDIAEENRMQCYSGTYMYELVRRQQSPLQFRSGNEVVIFTSGHVQPGYMVKTKSGYSLMAIETTSSRGGRRPYGLVENLRYGVAVVDAELFALTEIFADHITNPTAVAKAAIELTAKKYGLPMPENVDFPDNHGNWDVIRRLNQSIFAFGTVDESSEDRERVDSGDDGTQPDDVEGYSSGAAKQRSIDFTDEAHQELKETDCSRLNTITTVDSRFSMIAYSCEEVEVWPKGSEVVDDYPYGSMKKSKKEKGTSAIYEVINVVPRSSSSLTIYLNKKDGGRLDMPRALRVNYNVVNQVLRIQ